MGGQWRGGSPIRRWTRQKGDLCRARHKGPRVAHLACPTAGGRVEAARAVIRSRTTRQRGAPPRAAVAQPQARPYALRGRSCQGSRPTPLGGERTGAVQVVGLGGSLSRSLLKCSIRNWDQTSDHTHWTGTPDKTRSSLFFVHRFRLPTKHAFTVMPERDCSVGSSVTLQPPQLQTVRRACALGRQPE